MKNIWWREHWEVKNMQQKALWGKVASLWYFVSKQPILTSDLGGTRCAHGSAAEAGKMRDRAAVPRVQTGSASLQIARDFWEGFFPQFLDVLHGFCKKPQMKGLLWVPALSKSFVLALQFVSSLAEEFSALNCSFSGFCVPFKKD